MLLAGQMVNQFTGSAISGLTVQYAGQVGDDELVGYVHDLGLADEQLCSSSRCRVPVCIRRVTFARSGDNHWRVVPSSFSMPAFNDVARDEYGSSTIRWTVAPTVYVDSRPEGFYECRARHVDFSGQGPGSGVRIEVDRRRDFTRFRYRDVEPSQ